MDAIKMINLCDQTYYLENDVFKPVIGSMGYKYVSHKDNESLEKEEMERREAEIKRLEIEERERRNIERLQREAGTSAVQDIVQTGSDIVSDIFIRQTVEKQFKEGNGTT